MTVQWNVVVEVSPRAGIADPEGATIERALPALGFEGVSDVRVGKSIRLRVEADDAPRAALLVEDMCARFLINPVIEDARVEVLDS